MNQNKYPDNIAKNKNTPCMEGLPFRTTNVRRMDTVLKFEDRPVFDRLSSRMVKCAAQLDENEFIGWQMAVPQKGTVRMELFATASVSNNDLEWIAQETAKKARSKRLLDCSEFSEVYEMFLPTEKAAKNTVGFTTSPVQTEQTSVQWPLVFPDQFAQWIGALQQQGAIIRVLFGAATEHEQASCRQNVRRTFNTNAVNVQSYIGKPIRTRFLLRLPEAPSLRLKSILSQSIPGAKLRLLGNVENSEILAQWNQPLANARVLPDYAARIMLMEPVLKESIIGIEVCEERAKKLPLSHKNASAKGAVTIGKATDVSGVTRKVTIEDTKDLRRHYQIIGQTGCGKSTLLSTVILSAIAKGHGLTFFDPHGTTIDTVLRCVPAEHAHRVRVVRLGDVEHPVPLNIWDSGDPIKEEVNINNLCELFSNIFDPKNQGFVGPRYERWLSTFAKASLAYFGKQASLLSIAVISQNKDNMLKVAKAIAGDYPELYETIKNEYGMDNSSDFSATLNWYLCKFQRICACEQLRATLGAGANALDFNHSIDTDTVTLIDLASPTIGAHAARIAGTLTLMKLWNASIQRKNTDKTHLVVIDEASLFQCNPLPRMLSEGRKFGISCVLCHQHETQLSNEIRDALEANSANFSAFRLSPKDAATAAIRFDDATMQTKLARLDAFQAITTLSVDGLQTKPFTLETIRPKQTKNAEEIAAQIEQNSIDTLLKPFAAYRAMTQQRIQQLIDAQMRLRTPEPAVIRPAPSSGASSAYKAS